MKSSHNPFTKEENSFFFFSRRRRKTKANRYLFFYMNMVPCSYTAADFTKTCNSSLKKQTEIFS